MNIDTSCQKQILMGLAERETHSFLRKASRVAEWMIDVGAGAGELSLHFARLPNVTRVYAIEPGPTDLASNLALNPSARIDVIPKCAGAPDDGEGITLDSLPVNRASPGLVKIDVDGGEVDVLSGAIGLMACGKTLFLIETHSAALELGCLEALKPYDYHTKIVGEAWWRRIIPEQRPLAHNRWLAATPAKIPLINATN